MSSEVQISAPDVVRRHILSPETDCEEYRVFLEHLRCFGERVLWLCGTKLIAHRRRHELVQNDVSASQLNIQPVLSSRGTVTLSTYHHVASVLRNQRDTLLLDPADYAMTVFDDVESVSPLLYRGLLGRLATESAIFIAHKEIGCDTRTYLESLLAGDGYSAEPPLWRGQKVGPGWLEQAACGPDDAAMAECGPRNVTPAMRELCRTCPVKDDCLAMCLETEASSLYDLGFAGGLTKKQRDTVRSLQTQQRGLEAAAYIEFCRGK